MTFDIKADESMKLSTNANEVVFEGKNLLRKVLKTKTKAKKRDEPIEKEEGEPIVNLEVEDIHKEKVDESDPVVDVL